MSWTDERVTKLRDLWNDGLTASQIAKQLGGVSRNAVIGKAHRLGLSNRSASAKTSESEQTEPTLVTTKETAPPKAAPRDAATPKRAEAPAASDLSPETAPAVVADDAAPEVDPVAARAAEAERNSRKLSLLELNERTCKWPIGDPSTDDFYFCGLPCAPDKPYCAAHVAMAYQPMSSRRDRERDRSRAAAPRAISA